MADSEQLKILKQGIRTWNSWRSQNLRRSFGTDSIGSTARPDFSGADLRGFPIGMVDEIVDLSFANFADADLSDTDLSVANLIGADLRRARLCRTSLRDALLDGAQLQNGDLREVNLVDADLKGAVLSDANLTKANLNGAKLVSAVLIRAQLNLATLFNADMTDALLQDAELVGAQLAGANLSKARLAGANLEFANLIQARLRGADLANADLRRSSLIDTDLKGANLAGCRVFGTSIWRVSLNRKTIQTNLVITEEDESTITADNLEVAQFIHLLLCSDKIRDVIDTIGEKGVLILGRFTPGRKDVLNRIRERLRELGFVPMMFDFERPKQRDFTETIKTLAGMSRFIIADISNPRSSPLELQATVPDYMIPLVPIIQEGEKPFAMFRDLKQKYTDWVLDTLEYDSPENLARVLEKAVVKPALELSHKLVLKRAEAIRHRHVRDYA